MKRVLSSLIIIGLLSTASGQTNTDTYSADGDSKLIKNNIYYKTVVDASVIVFHEHKVNYEETVFKEYLPVVLKFQKMLYNRDIKAVIDTYIPETEVIDLMHSWEDYKKIRYKNIDDFKTQWINEIKNNTQIIRLDISLLPITEKETEWEKYFWYISPLSSFDNNQIDHAFELVIKTEYNDPHKPQCFSYTFCKINGRYFLTAGDVFYPNDDFMSRD